MLRLRLRLTVSLAAILAFLALSPGHKTSASPDLSGPWAEVYSEVLPTPHVNVGDCSGTLHQDTTDHYISGAGPSSCGGPTVLSGGSFDATLNPSTMILSGTVTFTSPYTLVVNFSGTVSADGTNISNGTWVDAFQSGTFVGAKEQTTPPGSGQTVTDPNAGDGASLTFGNTNPGGHTSIVAAPTADANLPPQFQLVGGLYYHVITTVPGTSVPGSGPYIFCADYPGTTGVTDVVSGTLETNLYILHLDAGVWHQEARYDGNPIPPGTDPVNLPNKVCASVDHLSQFALVAPVTSVTPSPTPNPNAVGGFVSIMGGDSSSGVSTWLWAATAGVAIAFAAAGGWLALGRRRLR